MLESNMDKKVHRKVDAAAAQMPHHCKVHCLCYFSGKLNSWASQKHG